MQYAACSPVEPRITQRQARQPALVPSLVSHRTPPTLPGRAGSLSGRPFCRIYLEKQLWVLELDCTSGAWIGLASSGERMGYPSGPHRLTFPTLSAAIGYAECHGLDYRVIPPPPPRRPRARIARRQTHAPPLHFQMESGSEDHRPRQGVKQ
jgi:hypothetical protein